VIVTSGELLTSLGMLMKGLNQTIQMIHLLQESLKILFGQRERPSIFSNPANNRDRHQHAAKQGSKLLLFIPL
jgi:hypothetical protein